MRGGSPHPRARAAEGTLSNAGGTGLPHGPGLPGSPATLWGTRSLTVALLLSPQAPKEALAQCVLAEVPQQVVGYFSTYKLLPPSNATAQ